MTAGDQDAADLSTAQWNSFMHAQGHRLSCCAWADPCPIERWADLYLRGFPRPYPVALVLEYLNGHESHSRDDR